MLRKILIGFLALIVLVFLASLFLPSKVHVERSVSINAPADLVFEQINNLKNWQYWSYWDNIDPKMKSEFEGPEAGVGAIHRWESDNKKVGKGAMKITKSEKPSFVETELSFEGENTSLGGWKIADSAGMVTVTGYMDMDMGMNPIGKFFGLMMEGMIGPDFEKTLAGLKKHSESLSKEAPVVADEAVPADSTAVPADTAAVVK